MAHFRGFFFGKIEIPRRLVEWNQHTARGRWVNLSVFQDSHQSLGQLWIQLRAVRYSNQPLGQHWVATRLTFFRFLKTRPTLTIEPFVGFWKRLRTGQRRVTKNCEWWNRINYIGASNYRDTVPLSFKCTALYTVPFYINFASLLEILIVPKFLFRCCNHKL